MNRSGHWLRSNHANRYPRRIICLDSEANRQVIKAGERHRFKLAVATYDEIDKDTLKPTKSEREDFDSHSALWKWVDSKTMPRNRTLLWAHNLGYDMRITQALIELPKLGWHLDSLSLAARASWSKWSKDGRSLSMVDFGSFVPRSLDRIAGELGMNKMPLPEDHEPDFVWNERCRQDVAVLREAVLQLLGWLESNDMGSFRLTGAAQATATFRHRFLRPKTILVHNNQEALDAERRAAWTGRCEVWKHGHTEEPLYEWDYSLAYATIAAEAMLPCQLASSRQSLTEMEWRGLRGTYRILSEVTAKARHPVIPCEKDGRILWPIGGPISSVLWDDEIELALQEKCKVEIGRSFLYLKRPALSDWATWIIEQLQGDNREANAIARIVIKNWSRQLIGRFGLRYPRWSPFGTSPIKDLFYSPFLDLDTNTRGVMFQVGNDLLEQASMGDSPDSSPAIMSAIMAAARIRLWNTMKAVGFRSLYYVDTDSIILDYDGSKRMTRIHKQFPSLRLKAQHIGGDFNAPRSIRLGDETRIAGLPRTRASAFGGSFIGEVWQSTTQSLKERTADEVNVRLLTFELKGDDFRREHLEGGETKAWRI